MRSTPIVGTLHLGALALTALTLPAWAGGPAEPAAAARADLPAVVGLPAGDIRLVSTTAGGTPASASSTTCALSADGRLALFASDAANLVAGDTNGRSDLFLKDLNSGAVQRVTTLGNGGQLAAGGNCLGTTMTPDGRLVAFNSSDAVFVKNTQTGQLVQASPPAGSVPQVRGFFGGALSDDGRSLVFLTVPETVYQGAYTWVNLVPARLMLRDLDTGDLQTLATDNGNVAEGQVIGSRFAISPDGSRVAFVSSSATLVAGDANGRADVFVRDLVSGVTWLASSTSSGAASTASQYWNPTFVSNHRVAFGTGGVSSLGAHGLYLKDLDQGTLTLVLSTAEGGATDAVLSGDARLVAYQRLYSGYEGRIFLRDLATGQELLVSASASGKPNGNTATGAVISRDGSTVMFGSNARNLVSPRPPAGVFQLYAKSTSAGAP